MAGTAIKADTSPHPMMWAIKILNFFCVVLGAFWTFLCAFIAILMFPLRESWGHAVQRFWAKRFLNLFGVKAEVHGLENLPATGGMVLAPNHQSNMDVMVLASLPLDFKWVSKTEVARLPLLGRFLRAMGSYLVRRDRSGHDLNVMRDVEKGLEAGNAVLIFPEGTRTRSGDLLPFKKGAFRTAQNTGVPLIPMGISGTYRIAPPGHLIPPRWGHSVTLRIGRPIQVARDADVNEVMNDFRRALLPLIESPRSGTGAAT